MNYNLIQKGKLLEKLFKSGFNTEKTILSIKLEDIKNIPDLSAQEIVMIVNLKEAIKNKKLFNFLCEASEERKEEK